MEPLRLVVEEGALAGREIPLEGQVLIGRDPSCTLVLPDRGVSRRHAMLAASPEGAVCLDLESRNGVRINGEKVRRATLREGDRLHIGEAVLVVQAAGGEVRIRDERVLAFSPWRTRAHYNFLTGDLAQAGPLARLLALLALAAVTGFLGWAAYYLVTRAP